MTFKGQIEYIFGSITANLTIFDHVNQNASDLVVSNIDDAVDAADTVADPYIVTIMGEKAYAIVNPALPDKDATLKYKSVDGGVVHVFVLEDPVAVSMLEEDDVTDIPLAGPWWAVEAVTDKLYTWNELNTLMEGVHNDNTNVVAPEGVADAELVEEDSGSERHESVGGLETTTENANAARKTNESIHTSGNGISDIQVKAETSAAGTSGNYLEKNFLNDAELRGKTHPDLDTLYNQNFTFMTGSLYGARDNRNTQDGKWQEAEMPLMSWLYGAEKNGGSPAWGLSRHPVGKMKEGASLVLASAIDGARTDTAIETIYAIVLDIDGGADLNKTIDTLIEKGLFSIVYTTFSHGTDTLTLKHDDIVKKLKLDGSPSLAQIKEYLATYQADKHSVTFISQVEILEIRKQTSTGVNVILKTPSVDKFRVIIPLWEPVRLSDLGSTVSAWKESWENAVCGVGVNMLDVNFDTASCDVNRLFYTPRHPKGRDDWYSCIIQGRPLRFEEIEPYSKAKFIRERKASGDAFALAGGGDDMEKVKRYFAPSGGSLNKWHTDIGKERFLIADVLTDFCEDKIRVSGNEAEGAVHIECPFEHEHSKEGGTATMAVNSIDSESGYWTWYCHHDSCKGRHKLEFLEEALKEEWFEESIITDEDFVMPPEDDAEEEKTPETVFDGVANLTPLERCNDFDNSSSEADIREFITELFKENVDQVIRNSVTDSLSSLTMLNKRDLSNIWRDLIRERVREDREASRQDASEFSGALGINTADFKDLCEYATNRIEKSNDKKPNLFHYMGATGRVREDEKGRPRIDVLTEDQFAYELNNISTFAHISIANEEETRRNVAAPKDVVKHLYNGDISTYPRLRGVVTSPTFASDGSMIVKPGFHHSSGVMYMPDHNTSIPPVSAKPTDDEVEDAKLILVDDVFADFPIGGYINHEELIKDATGPDGVPAMTTIIGMLLLFFCRDLIDGPTPGHLLTKPAPGTGASLLTEVCSIIGIGSPIGATALPRTDEEMNKTLMTKMLAGAPMIYFDNIDNNVNSTELASAMTSESISGRILGGMKDADVEVRTIWTLTGNNVQISSEILRRLVLVDLDARTDTPGTRSGFRKKDIKGWAKTNRGELVWACLTLIQNYVAKGQIPYRDKTLNSYENWAKVIGGIMRDAGIGGFLGNLGLLKDIADDETDTEINSLVEVWWEKHHAKPVNVKSVDDDTALAALAVAYDLELPVKKIRKEEGGMEYTSKSFGAMLRRYRGRVYVLGDGTKVTIKREDKRTSAGFAWYLELTNTPASNA